MKTRLTVQAVRETGAPRVTTLSKDTLQAVTGGRATYDASLPPLLKMKGEASTMYA